MCDVPTDPVPLQTRHLRNTPPTPYCRYIAQSWALFLTPASRASLLSTFTVIAVPCIAGLSGEKVKPLVWACGLAALVGTTLLEQGGGSPPNVGEFVCVGARVCCSHSLNTQDVSMLPHVLCSSTTAFVCTVRNTHETQHLMLAVVPPVLYNPLCDTTHR